MAYTPDADRAARLTTEILGLIQKAGLVPRVLTREQSIALRQRIRAVCRREIGGARKSGLAGHGDTGSS